MSDQVTGPRMLLSIYAAVILGYALIALVIGAVEGSR